jgi:hypothetical protein
MIRGEVKCSILQWTVSGLRERLGDGRDIAGRHATFLLARRGTATFFFKLMTLKAAPLC